MKQKMNMFVFFIRDYLAVMGLFVCAGHYVAGWLKRIPERQ